MLSDEGPPRAEEIETALARSLVYRFLSRAVSYPVEDHREEIGAQLQPRLATLKTGDPDIDAALADALDRCRLPIGRLQRAHAAVFGHAVSPDCPDYETAYSATDIFMQTQAMADVAGFYAAHGLQVGGAVRERPDHISTELEFMSFLAVKEAYALEHLGEEQVALCRDTETAFLRDHLGRWGPPVGERMVLLGGDDSPYAPVGRLLSAWLEDECERLGTGPREKLGEPTLPPPEAAENACGLESERAFIRLEDVGEVIQR